MSFGPDTFTPATPGDALSTYSANYTTSNSVGGGVNPNAIEISSVAGSWQFTASGCVQLIPNQGLSGNAQWAEFKIVSTSKLSSTQGVIVSYNSVFVDGFILNLFTGTKLGVRYAFGASNILTGNAVVSVGDVVAIERSGAFSAAVAKVFINGALDQTSSPTAFNAEGTGIGPYTEGGNAIDKFATNLRAGSGTYPGPIQTYPTEILSYNFDAQINPILAM